MNSAEKRLRQIEDELSRKRHESRRLAGELRVYGMEILRLERERDRVQNEVDEGRVTLSIVGFIRRAFRHEDAPVLPPAEDEE